MTNTNARDPSVEDLHRAVTTTDFVEVERLLDAGVNVNGRLTSDNLYVSGRTPLHTALTACPVVRVPDFSRRRLEVVEHLLKRGADPSPRHPLLGIPLILAAKLGMDDVVHALVSAGAPVDEVNDQGVCALREAVRSGRNGTVCALLDLGANVNLKDGKTGWTALHDAISRGATGLVPLLLRRDANLNATDQTGMTPLHMAVQCTNGTEMTRVLLHHGAAVNVVDQFGNTPLSWAARDGSLETVELLLEAGAIVNPELAVEPAVVQPLWNACLARDEDIARLLLDRGADPHVTCVAGQTALHVAARMGFGEGIVLLLEHESDIDHLDCTGRAPVQLALSIEPLDDEVWELDELVTVQVLVSRGCSMDACPNEDACHCWCRLS